MATEGKIPFLGFKASIKNVVYLGFGSGGTASGQHEVVAWDASIRRIVSFDAVIRRVVAVDVEL